MYPHRAIRKVSNRNLKLFFLVTYDSVSESFHRSVHKNQLKITAIGLPQVELKNPDFLKTNSCNVKIIQKYITINLRFYFIPKIQ